MPTIPVTCQTCCTRALSANLTIFKAAARERKNIFILMLNILMHIIDARCLSGSEIALTEIDALLGVAARIVVDDCWLTTNNIPADHDESFNTKQVAFEEEFLAENKLQAYQKFVICSNIAFAS